MLNLIERQTFVVEAGGRAWRYGEHSLRRISESGYRFVMPCHVAQFIVGLLRRVIGQAIFLLPRPANPKEYGLLVSNALRGCQAKDRLIPKVRRQHPSAFINTIEGNHHHQQATRHQPAKTVFKKDRLHTLVLSLADLEIIGRIQIQKRKRFDRRVTIESATVDNFICVCSGILCPVCIEFDRVAPDLFTGGDQGERHSCASARIEHRRTGGRKVEPARDSMSFVDWQRVITQFETCFRSQIPAPSFFIVMCV